MNTTKANLDRFGGLFELDGVGEAARGFINSVKSFCEGRIASWIVGSKYPDEKVSFYIVNGNTLNGHACIDGDMRYVALPIASIILIRHASITINYADRLSELKSVAPITSRFFDYENREWFDDSVLRLLNGATNRTFQTMLDFLVFHELAHHAQGHVGWLKKEHPIFSLSEHEKTTPGGVRLIDLHTLEMDADAFAVSNSLAGFLSQSKLLDTSNGPNIFPKLISTNNSKLEAALKFYVMSCYTLFRMFGDFRSTDSVGYFTEPHPLPHVRRALFCMSVLTMLHDWGGIDQSKLARSVVSACVDAERVYCRAAYIDFQENEFMDFQRNGGNDYLHKLLRNWAVLRPNLLEHALNPKLPLVQDL